MKKDAKRPKEEKAESAADSEKSDLKITESAEEVFTQEDFEDALKRVSRICEPDEETR